MQLVWYPGKVGASCILVVSCPQTHGIFARSRGRVRSTFVLDEPQVHTDALSVADYTWLQVRMNRSWDDLGG